MILFSKLKYLLRISLVSAVLIVGISILTAKASQPSNASYWQDATNSAAVAVK